MSNVDQIQDLERRINACNEDLNGLEKKKAYAEAEYNTYLKQLTEANFKTIEEAEQWIIDTEAETEETLTIVAESIATLENNVLEIKEQLHDL